MGRAYSVRKASIEKTGAAKAKVYSLYAREIYQTAKTGGTSVDSNAVLKRLLERAKKEQVPSDIIKRAIDKVNSGVDETYDSARYEIFGPGGSTLIVDCLTNNVNRTLSYVRPVLNKNNGKMGVTGSVSYMYDHLSVIRFKELTEEQVIDAMISNNIEVDDIENELDVITIYANPQDLFKMKEAITKVLPSVEFIVEEITMIPKDTINLTGEDLESFNKMLSMLEEIEDVQNIYHNVELNID
ncbi:MAG: YebC/PmpR family DNA-binding transcriptional regulator [Bacilli bacterium]|nr:YebC/PmpR family DNA-binding transcriptional regulator [Bacilli bacterium]MDD4282855.1 YebC/PmpR family DNA-binding transcriptional regulator [Bacilli bacterium]MDD4718678.1 YebC/PmpR family DNA-binding transcriptional regulator [Bacilli bacterium]